MFGIFFRVGASAAIAVLTVAQPAAAGPYDALIAKHAAANGVPESLVRSVMMRESKGNPRLVGSCGCYGLMQIKPATARAMGYSGTPAGLLDPDTNMTYAVRYLAGAYRAANGNAARADSYYRKGYHHATRYAAKRERQFETAAATKPKPAAPAPVASAPAAAAPSDVQTTGSVLPRAAPHASARARMVADTETTPAPRAAPHASTRQRPVADAETVPTPVAAPVRLRPAATAEAVPVPVAAPARLRTAAITETVPTPVAAPARLRTAAINETIPTPVAAPHSMPHQDTPATSTDAIPTPVAAPHKSARPRKHHAGATSTNPILRWLASWSTPAKARRSSSTAARM